MFILLKALRDDENGVILSAELAIVGSVLVVGAVTGLAALQKSIDSEMGDLVEAMENLDQTYSFSGLDKACRSNGNGNCHAYTAGSAFRDSGLTTEVCKKDIIGFEAQPCQHWQDAGECNACRPCGVSCGGRCGAVSACGSCGPANSGDGLGYANQSGCASFGCGSSDYGSSGGASSGVPRMRVTEYPGTWNVPRTTNEWSSPIRFPELEDPSYSGEFGQSRRYMQGRMPGQSLDLACPLNCSPAGYEIQEELQGPAVDESATEIPEKADGDFTDTNQDSGLKPVANDEPLPEAPPGDSKE